MEQYFEDNYLTPSWMPIEYEQDVELDIIEEN